MAPSLCSAVTKLNTTNDISRVLNCKQHPGHTTFFCFNVIFSPSSRSKMYISSALSYACTSWKVGPRQRGVAYIYIIFPYNCVYIYIYVQIRMWGQVRCIPRYNHYQSALALQVPFRGMETQPMYSQTTITFHHQKHPPHKKHGNQKSPQKQVFKPKKNVFILKA